MTEETDLIEKAAAFAREALAGQERPNRARQPKTDHAAEVAHLTGQSGGSTEEIAAAWLHDVVEDTPISLAELEEHFGPKIAALVDALTDPPDFEPLPLEIRKEKQAARLARATPEAKRVKLCDQISNIHSVLTDPPLDWNDAVCKTYIEGAYKIAQITQGLYPDLDKKIEELWALYQKRFL